MAPPRATQIWAICSVGALLLGVASTQGNGPSIPVKYCASTNTADMSPIDYRWQSQGRCYDNCTTASYALAIVQARSCWCSNWIPNKADQKPLSDCQASCPGYPDDYCGGQDTFGYMALNVPPSGTAKPGVTNTAPPSSSEDGGNNPPFPTVQTVTVGGVIRTVTATPPPTGDAQLAGGSNNGLSTGATVGIAVSIIGVFAVGAIVLFLWYLKRKRRQESDSGLFTATRRGSSPGMTGTTKAGEVSENRFAGDPDVRGAAPGWDSSGQSSKRRSNVMAVDPRLDPYAKGIYVRSQNKSHDSIGSLQDNQDYSRRIQEAPRVLRAVNPDPID